MSTTRSEVRTAELAGGLRTVVNRLSFHFRAPAARQGITPTRLTALAALEKGGPRRPGDLAERLGISAASMSRLTEVLEGEGWVARERDPDDHRACLLHITGDGLATMERLRREGTAELMADIDGLPAGQRRALVAALPVLIDLADKHLGPQPT